MHELFQISQGAIIIKDQKCLVMQFAQHDGLWGLPGGRINKGELDKDVSFARDDAIRGQSNKQKLQCDHSMLLLDKLYKLSMYGENLILFQWI